MMMKSFVLLFVLLGLLESCNQEDGLSYNHMIVSLATVGKETASNEFLLQLDNDTLLYPLVDDVNSFVPVNGQRVMINYTLLSKNITPNSTYDYKIRLNNVTDVLVKALTPFSTALNDSIGNDPIDITGCWVGSHYMNVTYSYYGTYSDHLISLVMLAPDAITADSTIHLEIRHNAYQDLATSLYSGVISFDISSLQQNNVSSVNIVVTATGTNGLEKVYSLNYKYGLNAMKLSTHNLQTKSLCEKARIH
jgi:hypothetical protein